MSFLVGSLAGAVATGGVYYGFSSLIQSKTTQHRRDLHRLCDTLVDASAPLPGPAPASKRIVDRPFATLVQGHWNAHVADVYAAVGDWERRASAWTRRLLYGET